MKSLKNYIFESGETRKYHIDRDCKSNIVVFDTENACISQYFTDVKGAQKYADDFDRISKATKKSIKSADHNLRFIVIDFDNLSPEAEECIKEFPDELKK